MQDYKRVTRYLTVYVAALVPYAKQQSLEYTEAVLG